MPSSAYLLEGLGGILATSATLPGQLMTRLAVLPPTILLWFIFWFLFSESEGFGVAVSVCFYLIRKLDNYLFGDARERGESHQWMYDRFNLQTSLKKIGFNSIKKHEYKSSDILGWSNFGLDLNANGNEYKVGSLYIEAVKPE